MFKVFITGVEALDSFAKDMGRIIGRFGKIIKDSRDVALEIAEDDLEEETPIETGEMVKSYSKQILDEGHGQIINEAPHARFLRTGTGLYGPNSRLIYPENTPYFKTKEPWNGRIWKFKYHRGMRPRDLTLAIDRLEILDRVTHVAREGTQEAIDSAVRKAKTASLRRATNVSRGN